MNGLLTPRPLSIVDRYPDGADAMHFTFALPAGERPPPVAPGQFFLLSVPGFGEAAFTYLTVPDRDGRFDALVRRVGSLTSALFDAPREAVLGHRGPFGSGWPLAELRDARVLVVTGGCGLAPLCAVIDAVAGQGASDASRVSVIYGARDEASQVLRRERASLSARVAWLETFDHPSEPSHVQGFPLVRIDEALLPLGGEADFVLVCGPEVMMEATARSLHSRGVPEDHIYLSLERRMHCGVGLCGHCYVANTYACKQGPTYRWDHLLALRSRSPAREPSFLDIRHC